MFSFILTLFRELFDRNKDNVLSEHNDISEAPVCETKACQFEPKRVLYEGVEYDSISQAAKANQVSRHKVRKEGTLL
jgi:hypothetical protein